jgi:3-methyladenine DNA glycosylase Tag
MMFQRITEFVQFFWMFESHYQQRLAWEDAAEARIARAKAEAHAAAQLAAMLNANPSGSLGHAKLNDIDALKRDGLL